MFNTTGNLRYTESASNVFIMKATGYTQLIFYHFYKGDNYCDFVCVPAHQISSEKGVYSKREEFAPKGSKFFPFRADPF